VSYAITRRTICNNLTKKSDGFKFQNCGRDDGREHDEHDTCPRLWCAVKGTKKPRRARCPFGVHISDFGGDKVSRTARSGSGAHHGVIIGEADEVDTVTAGALRDIVQAIVLAKEGRVEGASRDGPALKSTRRD